MNAPPSSGTALADPPCPPVALPRVVLVGVSETVRRRLEPALRAHGLEVQDCPTLDERVLDADAAVIEADRGAYMLRLTQALRTLLDDACIVSVIGWWSDYEADLIGVAHATLHAPVRDADLGAAVGMIVAHTSRRAAPVASTR